jgi:predicted RNase H-like HicB family nuclease
MLEPLLGSINREKVLVYLYCRNEGYSREIAAFFKTDLSQIQKQMERLEGGGVLYSRKLGKTRLYGLSPRYPFLNELKTLLDKTLSFYPIDEKEKLVIVRRRPRRKRKPLWSASDRNEIKKVLHTIGFFEKNRYFRHPETKYFIEFPSGPLSVGSQPVCKTVTMRFPTGQLIMISPTDCIKDRLAAYFHWNDRQCWFREVKRLISMKSESGLLYSEEDEGYIADIPDLRRCSAFGETPEKALQQVLIAKKAWLDSARKNKKPVPPPRYQPVIYKVA